MSDKAGTEQFRGTPIEPRGTPIEPRGTPIKPRGTPIQERGIVTDVIVPIAQSGVAGAVGAVVGNHLSKPKDPPPPPPPPSSSGEE